MGALAVLILGGIGLLAQFVAEHLTEILTVCAVVGAIWAAFALIKAGSARGLNANHDIAPREQAETPLSPVPQRRSAGLSSDGNRLWIPSSRSVAFGGHALGGMLYSGSGLSGVGNTDIEPALVDLSLPSLGVAARRCPEQFKKLFAQLYQEAYGVGLVLPKNRTHLTMQYRAASASLRGAELSMSPPLMDVTVLTAPVSRLQAVVAKACEQLNPYSRVVGKDPATAGTFEALVQLPVALWPDKYREHLKQVHDVAARTGRPGGIPFAKLRSWMPKVAELTQPKLKALSRALAGFGLAMEPAMRFGGSPPEMDSRVVVFADDLQTATEEASPRFSFANVRHGARVLAQPDRTKRLCTT